MGSDASQVVGCDGFPLGMKNAEEEPSQYKLCVSKPSLKFVKKFLRFSVFRPGYWEEKSRQAHEQRPEKCSMATGGNQRRQIGD